MRTKWQESIGKKYGRLIIINIFGKDKHHKTHVICLCECGKEFIGNLADIRRSRIKSCGCLQIDNRFKHGMSYSKIYKVWQAMVDRCRNPNNRHYSDYGGRGIKVCDRWVSFENFLADMGESPEGYSIDRINNNGNYEKCNCRWATKGEQNRNNRRNCLITYHEETKPVIDWANEYGLTFMQLWTRLFRLHWSTDRALTTPTILKEAI